MTENLVIADSDEHTEEGHLTEEFSFRNQMVEKRLRKVEGLRAEVLPPELNGEEKPDLTEILSHIGPCDLVLVEGYKGGPHPKIEARSVRSLTQEPLSDDDPQIIAIASDGETDTGTLPGFDVNDITGIADFIAAHLGLVKK